MEVDDDIKIDRFSPACPSEPESLTLKPLPCWAGISASERAERTAQMIAKIDAKVRDKAEALGLARIAAQDPHDRPQHTTHTPRPKAHASTMELWRAAVDKYRDILAAFRKASSQWFAGCFEAQFPQHCLRPPAWNVLSAQESCEI